MQKALIITYYWPPSGGAGVQRWVKFARYLPAYGIEPIVVTVDAQKASFPVLDPSLENEIDPDLRVYRTSTAERFHLYRKFTGKTQIPFGGFANEETTGWKDKISRFIRGNLYIPDARKGWNRFALEQCARLIESEDIGTVITTSPPHSTQLIGLALKRKYKLFWLADIRDPWTDIYYYKAFLHTPWARRKDRSLELQVLREADRVAVVSKAIQRLFGRKLGKTGAEKIAVIPNGFDRVDFEMPVARSSPGQVVLAYTGTMSEQYDIDGFCIALRSLHDQSKGRRLRMKLVGSISPAILQKLRDPALGLDLETTPHVSHEEAIRTMLESTALLLIIPRVKDNEGILTGKLFEYLASGRTIMGIGPVHGDAANILQECRAGEMFDYDDYTGMQTYLEERILHRDHTSETDADRVAQYERKQLTAALASLLPKP